MKTDLPFGFAKNLFHAERTGGPLIAAVLLSASAALTTLDSARADESAIGFWLPGFFGSMSAAPLQPGWSLAAIYYHANVSASGNAVGMTFAIGPSLTRRRWCAPRPMI
jgi:hypothetical protein